MTLVQALGEASRSVATLPSQEGVALEASWLRGSLRLASWEAAAAGNRDVNKLLNSFRH